MDNPSLKKQLCLFAFLVSPFYLNDLLYIFFAKNFIDFILIDYIGRAVAMVIILYSLKKTIISFSDLNLNRISFPSLFKYTLLISIFGLSGHFLFDIFGKKILPTEYLYLCEIDHESQLYYFDIYLGLWILAITEEIVFRGICYNVLKKFIFHDYKIVLVSSIIFGLAHWSGGVNHVASTMLTGAIYMIGMQKTKSIYPTIIAHYIHNYIIFS